MSLILTEVADGILTVTFNEPARRNPLGAEMRSEIVAALDPLPAGVRAVVFTGAEGVFSAGGDLATMPPPSPGASDERMGAVAEFIRLVAGLPVITVAAVEKAAAGASVGLACACDVVVAGAGAKFLLPFSRLGIVPDGGLLSLLPARVGSARARRLMLAGDPIGAEDGAAWGLVDQLVEDGQALPVALETAGRMAQRAPGSVSWIKQALAGGTPTLEEALAAEAAGQRELFFTADFTEGKAAFFEKRSPRFSGR
ncbi:2-(1,2-epoxy-1,2-dihydrophenyl)acetyl-CoA isomerase PaaG [Brevibacterium daeguense]|uniref:2-(1,2-epoxy-1,2-dihydrophenyl)acetyl-CoA isomerase PaaG n=1 Tax=Brevibacterium daeguense TaxID=909936 RepID=A0ABP8EHS2_9MICO|nr:enoyl-CoA hydratase-related protein [Brevibacterium daeguense]